MRGLDQQLLSDHSGLTVKLEGTSHTTTTDAEGNWRLKDVPPGVYTLSFAKNGITPTRLINTQFAGNGSLYIPEVRLYELPTFTITDIALTTSSSRPQFDIVGHISESVPSGHTRAVQIVYSTDPNSDFKATSHTLVGAAVTNFQDGGTELRGFIDHNVLAGKGITSGTTVYFKAYPAAAAHIYEWYPENREEVYTSVVTSAGSQVLTAVMP